VTFAQLGLYSALKEKKKKKNNKGRRKGSEKTMERMQIKEGILRWYKRTARGGGEKIFFGGRKHGKGG